MGVDANLLIWLKMARDKENFFLAAKPRVFVAMTSERDDGSMSVRVKSAMEALDRCLRSDQIRNWHTLRPHSAPN